VDIRKVDHTGKPRSIRVSIVASTFLKAVLRELTKPLVIFRYLPKLYSHAYQPTLCDVPQPDRRI